MTETARGPCPARAGLAVIVSGPSGCGKTTLVRRLLERRPDFRRSVSATTRAMRPGETKGESYIFLDSEEFARGRDAGELFEWSEHFGHSYGTPRRPVEAALAAGEVIILEIDVNGARQIKRKLPAALAVFIMPPSRGELMARLRGRRTENEAELSLRLARANMEMDARGDFDAEIVNDDIERAVAELEKLIQSRIKERVC